MFATCNYVLVCTNYTVLLLCIFPIRQWLAILRNWSTFDIINVQINKSFFIMHVVSFFEVIALVEEVKLYTVGYTVV